MDPVISLSIADMVLAFLISMLVDFPIEEAVSLHDSNDASYSVEAVH